MPLVIAGQPGPIVQSAGNPAIRMGNFGDMMVSELNPRYYEQVYRGNVFIAATQGAIAVTNLNATATGFILSNPAGSGKNLWLLDIIVAQTLAAAAAIDTIVLAANVNPVAAAVVHTTPLVVRPALLGGSATAVGLADSSSTLPAAPVVVRAIYANSISATATTSVPPYVKDEVAGVIGIAPGCSVSLSATTATSVIASMSWLELPV